MAEQTSTEILRSTGIAVVRHFLSIIAAYLISKGVVAPEILSEGNLLILASGLVAGLISLAWIIYNKLAARRLLKTAIEAPSGMPIEILKTEAASKPLLES